MRVTAAILWKEIFRKRTYFHNDLIEYDYAYSPTPELPQMRKSPMFCSDVTRMCWTPGWIFLFRRFRRFFFPVCDSRESQALLSPEVALWTWRALRCFWFKKHPLTSPNKRTNKISCLQAFHLPCQVWEWGFWVYEFTNWIWVWWVQLTKTICLMYILGEDGQNSENCGWNNWILLDLLVPWNDSSKYWNPDFFHHLWRDSPSSPALCPWVDRLRAQLKQA